MSWPPLSFGAPMVLWGLLALPVIWWLLRLTPPRPQTEVFPPLRILAQVLKKEETPHQSPWWLTLLRLLMAGLVVLALAAPVFNPRESLPAGGNGIAVVLDNGWSSATDWPRRVATAERLIADAGDAARPVILALTADAANAEIGPFEAEAALDRLRAAEPRPVPVDRPAVYARVAAALAALPGASIAILSDGLAADGDEAAFGALLMLAPADLVWIAPERTGLAGRAPAADNEIEGFALRRSARPATAPRTVTAGAFDERWRIADATLDFAPGATQATGLMAVLFELRNDFASIALDGEPHAGAVRVLDESASGAASAFSRRARPTRRSRCCRRCSTSAARWSPSPTWSSRRAPICPRRFRRSSSRSRR